MNRELVPNEGAPADVALAPLARRGRARALGGQEGMLSREQARELVVAELARPPKYRYPSDPTDLVVIDESTMERDWGWVFFYTSEQYLKTRDIRYALAGNAPYIVNRYTGEVRTTGTAQSIEHYIAEYERELARR
jgi:immunity protein 35 of polymorphic toxin system